MAEPTCVMHPFSYTTPSFSNETHEENPMYGMGESVSFGRYVCEELEWEKWSSFDSNNNRNRYVKEAEKYSKPGSVAQKKAYFEAHFKRMAALKAAALLDEANGSENTSDETNIDQFNGDSAVITSLNLHVDDNIYDQAEIVPKEGEINNAGEFVVHQNELYSIVVDDGNGNGNDDKNVNPPLPEHKSSDKIDIYSASKKDENCKASNEESSGIPQICKLPLQEKAYLTEEASVTIVKRNPPLSSYIPSPARSANPIYPGKENYATPVKKKSSVSEPDKKKTPLRMSINRELNRIMSPVIKKLGSSSKVSKDCSTDPSRTPAKASVSGVQVPPMTPDLSKRGVSTSPSMSKNKISSPIIPNSFCLRSADRTARRKQKLEDKFNATATEKAPQPSKFKEKAEAELNKFRQSFCFKSMASPDYYGDSGTFNSPKPKKESTNRKSPNEVRQANRTASQNKSALPPRRPSAKQIGLKSTKRTTHVPS